MTAASSFIDPAKIAAALAAQGAGSDGRTVLTGSALTSVLKALSGVTGGGGQVAGYNTYDNEGNQVYMPGGQSSYTTNNYTDSAGDSLLPAFTANAGQYQNEAAYNAAKSAYYQSIGLDPTGNYVVANFDNPTGNGSKDQASAIYRLDANGNAVPVGAQNRYSPGSWVDGGRQASIAAGAILSGGLLAGGAAGGAAAAGGGTSAGSAGALSSADLGALYSTGGYGEGLAGAGAAGDAAAGTAAAYGGVGSSGAGAGTDAIVNGTSAAGAGTGLTAGNASSAASLASQLGQGGKGSVATALAGLGAAAVNGSNSTNINTPNYQQAATAQGQSARTNQTNPYGSLTYTQNGVDAQGNPTYSQNVALNAQGQSNLNSAQQAQGTALGGLNNSLSGYSAAMAALPGLYGDTGSQSGLTQQAINSAYHQQTALLDPQYQQKQQALTSQLANQGITFGSQAYNTAMNNFSQQQDYAYGNARDSSITQGNALANQLFNQNLSAHTTGANDLTTQLNNYQNAASSSGTTANALNPTFATPPTATPYLTGAYFQGGGNLQQYNATTGANNSTTNGLFNLGGAVLSNPGLMSSIGNLFSTGGG